MSSHLLNADALRALKRPAVQKIAKREGVKANGKTDDIINALLEMCPNGVEPLEPAADPVRRSKRTGTTDVNAAENKTATQEENAAANAGAAATGENEVARAASTSISFVGDSISQYVPSRRRGQAEPAAQNTGASLQPLFAAPPVSPQPTTPQPGEDKPLSLSSSSSNSALLGQSPTRKTVSIAAPRPQSRLPFPLTDFQGSSRPVNHPLLVQLREEEHPATGRPSNVAARVIHDARGLNGASHSAPGFVQLLEEKNIRLAPEGAADWSQRPVDPGRGIFSSGVARPTVPQVPIPTPRRLPVDDLGSLPRPSPPQSSPTPELHSPVVPIHPLPVPRPVYTYPPPAPPGQEHGRTTGAAGPSRPRAPTLPARPPASVFSRPSPPPVQPVAGPSQLATQHYQPSAPFASSPSWARRLLQNRAHLHADFVPRLRPAEHFGQRPQREATRSISVIGQIADSLGKPSQVLLDMLGQTNFAGPPPDNAPAAVTADEDEGSRLPIALEISSSDSAEENINEGYAGADGENGDVGADGEPEGAKEHASGTAKPSRKDNGKGRATVVEDDDDAPADFWSTKGSFVPKLDGAESISPEDLEDMRLKLLEERTQRAVHDEPAAAPPAQDGPAHDFDFDLRKVKGCSGVEMLRIAQANAMRAEKIRAIRYKREQLQRDTSFLIEEARRTKILKWVLHSKRLALERMMNMQMSFIRYRSNSVDEGNGGNDGGDDSGPGGSGASGGSSNDGADNGEEDRAVEHDTGENGREDDERHENQGVSDKENSGVHEDREAPSTSKAAGKQVAPPVAAGQQAAQGMVRRLRWFPSISEAGPSTRQTAPIAPTLLPAWDADAPQSAKSGLDSSSDSDSSPSPVIPSAYARWRSPLLNPFTPPPRTSVPMRRNMQSARRPLPELALSPVARPPSVSPPRGVEAFPLAALSRVGTARRVSLAGAFALDGHNEHLLFGGGLSSSQESILQCMPRARPQPAEGGAGRSTSFASRDPATNGDHDGSVSPRVNGVPRRPAYVPLPLAGYNARSAHLPEYRRLRGVPVPERLRGKPANQARRNGAAEEEREWRDSGEDDHGAPDEEEPEPFYEYSGPSAFAGYRGLRGTNVRAPSPS